MQRIWLILFVTFELCYYLLIAQTGLVEYFHSDIFVIGMLPLGGIIGALFTRYCIVSKENLLIYMLVGQSILTLFYPDLSLIMLFLLGFCIGGIAPLLIVALKNQKDYEMGIALALAYMIGTILFNIPVENRQEIALLFSVIAVWSASFISLKTKARVESTNERFPLSILGMMTLWAFMDSTLFETLSRDPSISIWRGGYELPIILFHFAGIVTALFGHTRSTDKERFILLLFALSYLSYFFHEALVLAMVYPFVISYYNVVILQEVIKIKSFGTIVIVMICIGWIASGIGLMVALQGLIGMVVPIWLIAIGWMIKINFKTKEIHHV